MLAVASPEAAAQATQTPQVERDRTDANQNRGQVFPALFVALPGSSGSGFSLRGFGDPRVDLSAAGNHGYEGSA
jgi:hypothetical protein